MQNKYFKFLCNIVDYKDCYLQLLKQLYSTEFYALIPNDDNRGSDGANLRNLFLDEGGPTGPSSLPEVECTVLEMMIGLAYRIEFETSQSKWEKSVGEWFWVLIDNLGLADCTDEEYANSDKRIGYVNSILFNFLERDYRYDGDGGLFPLTNPKKDQRRVELWYQMNAYIIENYPI